MDLLETTQKLVAKRKGILAADESNLTIGKRFDEVGIADSEEMRRSYREMLFATPNISEFISGVILYKETFQQTSYDGKLFPDLLQQSGIITGIKVDEGTRPLTGSSEELITEGLDGLADRLAGYAESEARFAKWRAVISIGDGIPTSSCIEANAHALARYAALCQEAKLVPIVEPEVLMDGDHTIERCGEVTETVLTTVFSELKKHGVVLEGMLLKPNMVLPGEACPTQESAENVAEATLASLRRTVPEAVPGIVFLSGGQNSQHATECLQAMNALDESPWELSFSYGRALQKPAMEKWAGQSENIKKAQSVFLSTAENVSAARDGLYSAEWK